MRIAILIVMLAWLTGCATSGKTILVEKKISDPKVVALDAPRTPWVIEIETRLRERGFKVLRWASQKYVTERVTEAKTEEYKEAATRYVLAVNGFAPLGVMYRCFAGGYNFQHITAELIDTQTNETIVTVSGSGYSENCPPMSGTIFTDIVSAVADSWAQP